MVVPGQPGPYSGSLPDSLVRPDRKGFAPRVGFAWKPFSKTVVRGGYGINYNTGAYQTIAQQLGIPASVFNRRDEHPERSRRPHAGQWISDAIFQSAPPILTR